jgi:hypothetical protein
MTRTSFIFAIFTIFVNTTQAADCKYFDRFYHIDAPYSLFEGAIKRDKELLHRIEIQGEEKELLVLYAKKMNGFIVNNQVDKFIENISTIDFRSYHDYLDASSISANISSRIIQQLRDKSGLIYYYLFRRQNNNSTNKSTTSLDIRSFLICFQERLLWRVLYSPQKDQYDVWFSMPDGFMIGLDFFHYVVKKQDNQFVLVGF